MATIVDARGLACPQPVIQTRKAMQKADQIVTLVDNETSVTNVSRMAARAGWQVRLSAAGEEFRHRDSSSMRSRDRARGGTMVQIAIGGVTVGAPGGPLVLVVSSDIMGRGDDELGNILIRGFFHTLGEVEPSPNDLIFFNAGSSWHAKARQ